MTIAVISEFAGNGFDGLVPSAAAEIERRYVGSRVVFVSGFLKRYIPGGLRPLRLLNYCVVYARMALRAVRDRPKVFLVDTTPPLTQWWAVCLGFLVDAHVYVWLMDYHPEIEAQYFERIRGLGWLGRVLRGADRRVMKFASGIVTLDEAMVAMARAQRLGVEIKLHPPWSKQGAGLYEPIRFNTDQAEFRVAYVGNLGAAHGLGDLEELLARVSSFRKLRLLYVGANPDGYDRFRQMANRLGGSLERERHLEWCELRKRLSEFRPDYGIVILDEKDGGLVSPCKYATYLLLGMPILYVGPRLTNTDLACRQIGAGVAVTHEEIARDDGSLVHSLLDSSALARRRLATRSAYEWQSRFNEVSFVQAIQGWLTLASGASEPVCAPNEVVTAESGRQGPEEMPKAAGTPPQGSRVLVRNGTQVDVDQLVNLHYRVFDKNTHNLLVLRRRLITRAYCWYCESPSAFAVVAETDRGIVGSATVNLGDYYRFFRKNWEDVVWAFICEPYKLFHPLVLSRLKTLVLRNRPRRQTGAPQGSAYLAYLVVDSNSQGNGIGRALIRAAIEGCKDRGWEQLVTCLHRSNQAAYLFYQKVGFERFTDLDTEELLGIRICTAAVRTSSGQTGNGAASCGVPAHAA
jgi:ribosomal protein S18 acetylase RimI-like enzyme